MRLTWGGDGLSLVTRNCGGIRWSTVVFVANSGVKPRENPISEKWQNGNFDQNPKFF